MKQPFALLSNVMKRPALMAAIAFLAACNSEEVTQPQASQAAAFSAAQEQGTLPPPRGEDFVAAWSEACPDAEPAARALCKANGIADPNFTCDFALGDDEFRRNTAELTRGEGRWELAEPETACEVG